MDIHDITLNSSEVYEIRVFAVNCELCGVKNGAF